MSGNHLLLEMIEYKMANLLTTNLNASSFLNAENEKFYWRVFPKIVFTPFWDA